MSETKAKWTPGPWYRDLNEGIAFGIRASGRKNIVNWRGLSAPMSEEGQANAHLIAAAPAMAEALEKALTQMRVWVSINGDMVGALQEVIDEGEAALALAKGETK